MNRKSEMEHLLKDVMNEICLEELDEYSRPHVFSCEFEEKKADLLGRQIHEDDNTRI